LDLKEAAHPNIKTKFTAATGKTRVTKNEKVVYPSTNLPIHVNHPKSMRKG